LAGLGIESTAGPVTRAEGDPQLQDSVSDYDLPTLDKIPVIKRLMAATGEGLALDIGIGTGYTTTSVFEGRPTVCLDLLESNLQYHRRQQALRGESAPLCTIAVATALPYADGSIRYILCSEVLEHLEDDDTAVAEIARVLKDDGRAVITVPYNGRGYASFLERLGIRTVHDYPGPEYHVRNGYDESSLSALMENHGLRVLEYDYFLRFFTRLIVDSVSLAHIGYQRVIKRRRSWTWAEAAEVEGTPAFRLFTLAFPMLRFASRGDALLRRFRGFGLVASIAKVATNPREATD
jgi:ubiquinone/menaquinone biosynthesis C-methylase UbiE